MRSGEERRGWQWWIVHVSQSGAPCCRDCLHDDVESRWTSCNPARPALARDSSVTSPVTSCESQVHYARIPEMSGYLTAPRYPLQGQSRSARPLGACFYVYHGARVQFAQRMHKICNSPSWGHYEGVDVRKTSVRCHYLSGLHSLDVDALHPMPERRP